MVRFVLGGEIGEENFTRYMKNLNLPHPRQIEVAVPLLSRTAVHYDQLEASHDYGGIKALFAR